MHRERIAIRNDFAVACTSIDGIQMRSARTGNRYRSIHIVRYFSFSKSELTAVLRLELIDRIARARAHTQSVVWVSLSTERR